VDKQCFFICSDLRYGWNMGSQSCQCELLFWQLSVKEGMLCFLHTMEHNVESRPSIILPISQQVALLCESTSLGCSCLQLRCAAGLINYSVCLDWIFGCYRSCLPPSGPTCCTFTLRKWMYFDLLRWTWLSVRNYCFYRGNNVKPSVAKTSMQNNY